MGEPDGQAAEPTLLSGWIGLASPHNSARLGIRPDDMHIPWSELTSTMRTRSGLASSHCEMIIRSASRPSIRRLPRGVLCPSEVVRTAMVDQQSVFELDSALSLDEQDERARLPAATPPADAGQADGAAAPPRRGRRLLPRIAADPPIGASLSTIGVRSSTGSCASWSVLQVGRRAVPAMSRSSGSSVRWSFWPRWIPLFALPCLLKSGDHALMSRPSVTAAESGPGQTRWLTAWSWRSSRPTLDRLSPVKYERTRACRSVAFPT